METMDIGGSRIPTPEEREAVQPLPFTIPRWVNNILVMTCTALTTVTIGIIFVLLAKHFKMKALVSGIALSTLPPPTVEAQFDSSSYGISLNSSKSRDRNKSDMLLSSGCCMAKHSRIFGIDMCHCTIF